MRADFFPASLTDSTPSWKSWGISNKTYLLFALKSNMFFYREQGMNDEKRILLLMDGLESVLSSSDRSGFPIDKSKKISKK